MRYEGQHPEHNDEPLALRLLRFPGRCFNNLVDFNQQGNDAAAMLMVAAEVQTPESADPGQYAAARRAQELVAQINLCKVDFYSTVPL
jgi:hypothetical protein